MGVRVIADLDTAGKGTGNPKRFRFAPVYTVAAVKLVKPNLPEETLEYKDRHVWPLKARHDKLAKEGNFNQVEARRVLIPALARYVRFLAGCEPTPELEREAEWAAGELATLGSVAKIELRQEKL